MEIENISNTQTNGKARDQEVIIRTEPESNSLDVEREQQRKESDNIQGSENEINTTYSYQSSRFWCFKCQKEFSKLRISETNEVRCPKCKWVTEEITNEHDHPKNFCVPNYSEQERQFQQQQQQQIQQQQSDNQQSRNQRTFIYESFHLLPNGHIQYQSYNNNTQNSRHVPHIMQMPMFPLMSQNIRPRRMSDMFSSNDNFFGDDIFGFLNNFNLRFISNEQLQQLIRQRQGQGPPPADEEQINQLQSKIVKPEMKELMKCSCPICQDNFKEQEKVIELKCEHQFHEECVKKWLKMHNSCPMCRKAI